MDERPSPAWHALALADVLLRARSSASGLTDEEAATRQRDGGFNEISSAASVQPWRILLAQFTSLIVLILIAAAIVSGAFGEWVDAIAIVTIVVMNGVIGFYQEYNAERSIAALRRMTAPQAKVRRAGVVRQIPSREVVAGDILLVEAGDIVAADARLITSASLACMEATLTGESVPVEKSHTAERPASAPLGDRSSMIHMGTSVTAGSGEAVVVVTGMTTQLGLIAGLMHAESDVETPLQKRLQSFGRTLVYASLAIVLLLFVLGMARGEPPFRLFLTAVSLAVAAIPEGLPAVVTVALALGVQRMARRRVLIRKLAAVETLGSTSVICTDKTGTLTYNQMTVRALIVDGRTYAVTGDGYAPAGQITAPDGGQALADAVVGELVSVAAGCTTASLVHEAGTWSVVGDPTEGALLALAAKAHLAREQVDAREPKVAEHPFDSDRKMMTVVRRRGDQCIAYTKGAPDILLQRCTHVLTRDGARLLDEHMRSTIAAASAGLATKALRVLGAAIRPLSAEEARSDTSAIERSLTFVGLFGMYDPPRPEATAAVATCRNAGIRVVMITGDHPSTAFAIGREIGIAAEGDRVMSGAELDALDEPGLRDAVRTTAVYARVTAHHKLRIVKAWKANGAVVAMTGDGVNDAPAIKGADIGIAMGRTGSEVTKEAADMVVTDDNFASIVAAVEEGRGIYANIRKTVQYLLAGNTAEILLMTTCALLALPAPLEPVHLLWINLVTDGLPALCLAADRLAPHLMRNPPRPATSTFLDRHFIIGMVTSGVLISGVAFAVYLIELRSGTVESARTHAFAVLVFAELLRALAARDDRLPLWRLGLFGNIRLVVVIAVGFAIQIASHHVPWLARLFRTEPISTETCISLIMIAFIPLLLLEGFKVLRSMRATTEPVTSPR